MLKSLFVTSLVALAVAGVQPVRAQSVTGYGSAVLTTLRNCNSVGNSVCDGSQAPASQTSISGGPGASSTASFSGTGAGAGSSAFGAINFGALGLPSIAASAAAVGDVRVGSNLYFYQTYTYTGSDPIQFGLAGNLHIDGSTTDGSTGIYRDGAIAIANLSIWNASAFDFPESASDMIYSTNYTLGCGGNNGILASGRAGAALPGGEQTYSFGTSACDGGGTITLHSGDQIVVAGLAQFLVNRGGSIDATHTFSVSLDPMLDASTRQTLSSSLAYSAAPEPATWAFMILGFSIVGAACRRAELVAFRRTQEHQLLRG